MGLVLNEQQNEAVSKGIKWWISRTKQVFEISGPAGSGKTTIIYAIVSALNIPLSNVLFVAYVGKATLELTRKGNNAKTIHSTIYDLTEVAELDEDGKPIKINGKIKYRPEFIKKEALGNGIELLVLDEAGMVNENIALDLLSFGIPLIALGDLDQLPPVFGESYFLRNPDVILTQVMRQAEGDPIIHLSTLARTNQKIYPGKYGDRCYVVMSEQITDDIMKESSIMICGRNKTRDNLNFHMRYNILQRKHNHPIIGDKIICRQNNWKLSIDDNLYLINGMNGYIENIYPETFDGKNINIDFRPEFLKHDYYKNISIDYRFLFMDFMSKKNYGRSYTNRFEFGWAITTHLSQGSQYDKVLLFNERMGDRNYYRRWLYTGITRARTHLIIAM